MKLDIIDRIKKLNQTAEGCETFYDRYNGATAESHIDKYGEGFSSDTRYALFNVDVSFCAKIGAAGSSNCSTFRNGIDPSIAQEYAKKSLQDMRAGLLSHMARLMREDAKALVGQARAELEAMSAIVDSVTIQGNDIK